MASSSGWKTPAGTIGSCWPKGVAATSGRRGSSHEVLMVDGGGTSARASDKRSTRPRTGNEGLRRDCERSKDAW